MAANKIGNEYADVLGSIFDKTPKAVLAAMVVSLIMAEREIYDFTPDSAARIQHGALDEWAALYNNGIVPQKPPASVAPSKSADTLAWALKQRSAAESRQKARAEKRARTLMENRDRYELRGGAVFKRDENE